MGSSGLWLGELSSRLRVLKSRPDYTSMMDHVPGPDLRAMIAHLAKSQMPRHDPTHEPLPSSVDNWYSAFDAGADVTTYEGVGL